MQRVYYQIDEALAKRAHAMMSFRDYPEGSKTAEYKSYVDKAYELAEKAAEARPDEAEKIYRYAERYSKKMAENMNASSRIGCMCPSVMISGSGNFPVKKKEKQNKAYEKNMAEWNDIQKILEKIQGIANGKDIIKAGDVDAVEKLEDKLKKLKEMQEKMKAANKAIRMKDIEKGDAKLSELGYSEEQIIELRKPDFCGRIGFPDYVLRNNNAEIHRLENRLQGLKKAKETGNKEQENEFFKVVENTEIMRLQIFFDNKPEAEVRDILKRNGFRWSPKSSAWQRQLNSNGKAALARVVKDMEGMK